MSEAELKVLDIDALIKPVARAKVAGKERAVMPLSGRSYSKLIAAQKNDGMPGSAQLELAQSLTAQILPDLTDEDLGALTVEQMLVIINIAAGQIGQVMKVIDALEGKDESRAQTAEIKEA